MKVIAFNGSPRKSWNTATLLNKALEGAASQGAETEIVHLYDLSYKGCASCFECKRLGSKSYGRCASRDDLTPFLKKVEEADVLLLGCPIYLGAINGEMRSLLERLVFPYLVYDTEHSSLFPKKIPTAFIYTMNVNEAQLKAAGYEQVFNTTEMFLKKTFGSSESLVVTDTCQFADYSKYLITLFDPVKKAKRREKVFPNDCKKAFDLGARLTIAGRGSLA